MKQLMKIKASTPSLIIALALACFGLFRVPKAFGVVPPPDGGYPGGNTAEGRGALFSLTSGAYNTAVGLFSLRGNAEGSFNTAIGAGTLLISTGEQNTATGAGALLSNTTGANNTANGAFALFTNTTGQHNTANGDEALFSNTEGRYNTANGDEALFNNIVGNYNTANGAHALASNTIGRGNTASGFEALFANTTGNFNTAGGNAALGSNTTGESNTATGDNALFSNATGLGNTAVGAGALSDNTTGNFNTALGINAGGNVTTGNNVIAIGHPGANVNDSCYIANIFGATVDPNALLVGIDSNGKLGTIASSKRFKEEIKPMDKASEALLSLKPVTFRYKNYQNSPLRFGLIAEEVADVNPDLVARDNKGEIYTVRYDQINAMLLNEFLKEHNKVEEQQATITELKRDFQLVSAWQQKEIQILSAQLKEQAAQIEKVSAQVDATKPLPRLVLNNP
jgi:hypothetical protein